MKIDGKEFKVNNEDKIFYPDKEYDKADIMDYYKKIAPYMLPHLNNRALTMVRYPDGIEGKRFYQKESPDYFPEWIKTKTIKKKDDGKTRYVVCSNKATLVYLTSQASLAVHPWLSTIDAVEKPDKIIFDLDPSDSDFSEVKFAAKSVKQFFLDKLGASPCVMTTGSSGLHVVIPIEPTAHFDTVLSLSRKLAKYIEDQHPDKLTTETRKKKRGNKIYLDVMRNAFAQTAVAPYSLRARNKAPVATPLEWDELSGLKSAQAYTIGDIFKRLAQRKDPWKNIRKQAVKVEDLSSAFDKLS